MYVKVGQTGLSQQTDLCDVTIITLRHRGELPMDINQCLTYFV